MNSEAFSPPVLFYHRIAETINGMGADGLSVSPKQFDMQMQILFRKGYRTLTLDQAIAGSSRTKRLWEKSIVITFDDGYRDNYLNALPVLQKYGFCATVFVVTDYIGKVSGWDEPSYPMMDWAQVKEMARHGIDVQSHTRTHPDLTALADQEVFGQLSGARTRIEDALGQRVSHLAYPYGRFHPRLYPLMSEAGYRAGWAAGMAEGSSFARERFQITSTDNAVSFGLKISRWGGFLRKLRHVKG